MGTMTHLSTWHRFTVKAGYPSITKLRLSSTLRLNWEIGMFPKNEYYNRSCIFSDGWSMSDAWSVADKPPMTDWKKSKALICLPWYPSGFVKSRQVQHASTNWKITHRYPMHAWLWLISCKESLASWCPLKTRFWNHGLKPAQHPTACSAPGIPEIPSQSDQAPKDNMACLAK